jgi:hypothetical protein
MYDSDKVQAGYSGGNRPHVNDVEGNYAYAQGQILRQQELRAQPLAAEAASRKNTNFGGFPSENYPYRNDSRVSNSTILSPGAPVDWEAFGQALVWPFHHWLALILGFMSGVCVGAIPQLMLSGRYQSSYFYVLCLSMGCFFAGLFGAIGAIAKRRFAYALIMVVAGCFAAQLVIGNGVNFLYRYGRTASAAIARY